MKKILAIIIKFKMRKLMNLHGEMKKRRLKTLASGV